MVDVNQLDAAMPLTSDELDALNWLRHRYRMAEYEETKDNPRRRDRLVIEGDSWFLHPFEKDIYDVLFSDFRYRGYCLSAAGDTLQNMVAEGQFLEVIKAEQPRAFLLSGGGNDLVDQFHTFLQPWQQDLNKVVDVDESSSSLRSYAKRSIKYTNLYRQQPKGFR